ncbi:MAG TPA: acetate/propionate family kinase [Tepidisphaeraceae bacterium]
MILAINGGSSSIKFALFSVADPPSRLFSGQIQRIGQPGTQLLIQESSSTTSETNSIDPGDFDHATDTLIQYLHGRFASAQIIGIGHRIVDGGAKLIDHQLIAPALLAELRAIEPIDLDHLPLEISLIEAFGNAFPNTPQIACFDTAFHRDIPRVAAMLPIPRCYYESGVRRFGFHGLSYTYLMQRLEVVAGATAAQGRIILAHLGSGASMAAVRGGKPIDTTMAFTPTAGLIMGTRPGDIDPGLLVYLMRAEKMTLEQMDQFISKRCGLLGISETSSDMRDLLSHRASDARSADAVNLFCYQARKFIGALAAALDGLDILVFSGGIGEHASEVRAEICAGLTYMGVALDSARNIAGKDIISHEDSRVTVRVITTDEELIVAQIVRSFLGN